MAFYNRTARRHSVEARSNCLYRIITIKNSTIYLRRLRESYFGTIRNSGAIMAPLTRVEKVGKVRSATQRGGRRGESNGLSMALYKSNRWQRHCLTAR